MAGQKVIRGEVIAIGDELTTGQRLDTNTQWLSQRLTELGVTVVAHTTVADDLDLNRDAFAAAAERAELVVCTGGLGPTADDLTRDALAAAAGVSLVTDAAALAHVESLYRSRGREMPPQNRRQAEFPEGATPIANLGGTAPGVDFQFGDARVFALPGVPAEMKQMWAETVGPTLYDVTKDVGVMRHHLVKCFGVGESQLEAMLPDLFTRGREPQVGITASKATITLRVTARGADEAACREAMQPTLQCVRETLGDLIYAECGPENEIELHTAVVDELAERRLTVATSEAMTGGLLGHWLAEADDDRGAFAGGVLRLPTGAAVDAAAAEQEAVALRDGGATFGVVVGAMGSVEPAQVIVAAAGPDSVESKRVILVGHPSIHRSLVSKHAINLVRQMLLGLPGGVAA
ncbi:MAG: CinA family nicotinamide mononucleotide deamidase-related protein [Planctomycetota bacterium]